MEINEITNLGTAIEMRREILKLAIAKEVPEEHLWIELDFYRKRLQFHRDSRSPRTLASKIADILPQVRYRLKLTHSPIEERLKFALLNRNIKFTTQERLGPYKVDFFIEDANLIIEADGHDYHSKPKQMRRDSLRDKQLMTRGYTVLRFRGSQILGDIDSCMVKILQLLGG